MKTPKLPSTSGGRSLAIICAYSVAFNRMYSWWGNGKFALRVRRPSELLGFLELEKIVERGASVGGISRSGGRSRGTVAIPRGRGIAGHGDARLEQFALVRLVLHGDAHWDRLQALKTGGRLEVGALLAAMQGCSAFRAGTLPLHIGRQGGGAAETSCRNHVLQKARKARPRDIDRRPGARRFPAIFSARTSGFAIRILVAALSILTVVVHLLF